MRHRMRKEHENQTFYVNSMLSYIYNFLLAMMQTERVWNLVGHSSSNIICSCWKMWSGAVYRVQIGLLADLRQPYI